MDKQKNRGYNPFYNLQILEQVSRFLFFRFIGSRFVPGIQLGKEKRGGDVYGMFFVLLCIACFQDVRTGKISNLLILSVLVTGGFYSFSLDGWTGLARWLAELLVYALILYPLYKMGALGAGDVKLMAAVEGVFNWNGSICYFVLVWVVAGLISLGKMLAEGNFVERLEYFFSYVADLVTTGEWKFYHADREQGTGRDRTVHMSVPVLIAFVLCMGG